MNNGRLVAHELCKTYPNGVKAVQNLSFTVNPGEVFGLVGPNGAGKTTLLKLLSGLLSPESGTVCFGDRDVTGAPRKAAHVVGLMPDPLGVYTDIAARDYLEFFARLLELPAPDRSRRIDKVVELLELGPWMDAEVETLSAGWQRRLALGRILLADLPVLLLDEPAAGLDVAARSELLSIVRRLASDQRTVVVSSHILPELQELADVFGVVNNGAWVEVKQNSPFFTRAELAGGLGGSTWLVRGRDARAACAVVQVPWTAEMGDTFTFTASDEQAAAAMLRTIMQGGIDVYEFRREGTDLTDVVLQCLKEGAAS